MSTLGIKRITADLARVVAARLDQEYLVAQKEDEIERIKKNIEIQVLKEQELKLKLEKGDINE